MIAEGAISPFLPLFAFKLKATNIMIGLLKTLPQFASLFMQIIWGEIAEALEKKKWLIVTGGIIWALIWIPVAYAQTAQELVVLITVQAVFSSMTVPAWTALLIKSSPFYKRGEVIANLNRYSAVGSLLGNIVAGVLLNMYGFIPFLFFMCTLLGIISKLLFLPVKEDSKVKYPEEKKILDLKMTGLNFTKNKRLSRLTLAISALKFAVFLPSPFFAIYIVNNLNGTTVDVAAIAAIGALASILFYRSWGYLIDYLGRKTILVSCLIPITLIPFVYAFSNHVAWIYLYTIIADISWAGFNLAEFAYLSDVVPSRKTSSYIAYYNLFTGLSIAIAPLIGGIIAQLTSIWLVFIISTIGRILSMYFFDRLEEKTGTRPHRIFNFNFESFGIMEKLDTFAATYAMAVEGVRKEINGYKFLRKYPFKK